MQAIFELPFSCDEDDRNVVTRIAQRAAKLEPTEMWHIHIEEDEVGELVLNEGQCATRVLRKFHGVALLGQQEVEHPAAEGIVIYDKDTQMRASCPPEEAH